MSDINVVIEDAQPIAVNMGEAVNYYMLPGPKGDTGPQGIQGPKGDTGERGPQGPKGDTGATGAKGDTGLQGLKGDKGDTGSQGIQGVQGQKGDTGEKGDKGDTGLQGPKGDPGNDGVIQSIVAGSNVSVDNTDPANPIISTDLSSLATVATTGDYDDLSNKPIIPDAQVQSDWDATSGISEILNKPTLGTAAGADTSEFATAAQGATADTAIQPGDLAAVATSGAYDDLIGVPSIPSALADLSGDADDISEGTTNLFLSSSERTKLSNTSGTNTGDQDLSGLVPKATTVNGYPLSASITVTASDVGLGNVNNTSDADKPISTATQTALDDKADLVGGLIPTSQIPAQALTTVQTASSQSAMLALTTEEGDIVVRSDEHKSYMRNSGTTGTMADFTLLDTPTDLVTSVNSQIGTVVLGKSDIGLGNVDNTSDATKNAASAALTNKDLTSGTNTFPTFNQNTTGSAAKLTTARNINGVAFDGTTDITIADSTKVPTTRTVAGTSLSGNVTQDNITGLSSTGIVKRTGTNTLAIASSGTDYAPATSGTSILKGNGSGGFSSATAGTDYVASSTVAKISQGTTAPSTPATGDLWVDTN